MGAQSGASDERFGLDGCRGEVHERRELVEPEDHAAPVRLALQEIEMAVVFAFIVQREELVSSRILELREQIALMDEPPLWSA